MRDRKKTPVLKCALADGIMAARFARTETSARPVSWAAFYSLHEIMFRRNRPHRPATASGSRAHSRAAGRANRRPCRGATCLRLRASGTCFACTLCAPTTRRRPPKRGAVAAAARQLSPAADISPQMLTAALCHNRKFRGSLGAPRSRPQTPLTGICDFG
jgi:hypothetical protein